MKGWLRHAQANPPPRERWLVSGRAGIQKEGMPAPRQTILIVEDEAAIAETIVYARLTSV